MLKFIPGVGKVGDVKEVAEGYAENFLFPRKLAKKATKEALQTLKNTADKQVVHSALQKKEAQEIFALLLKDPVVLVRRSKGNHLFGSVTADDIKREIISRLNKNIDVRVNLSNALKTIGEHTFTVTIFGHQSERISVIVKPMI